MEFQVGKHDLTRHGLNEVDAATVEHFLGSADEAGAIAVLLSAGDPNRFPEATDVAVVLPELIAAFGGGCAVRSSRAATRARSASVLASACSRR